MPNGVAATVDSSRRGSVVRRTSPVPPLPGTLLPPGEGGTRASPPASLASEARALLTRAAAHPPGTRGPAFAREVERYRRHLAPIELPPLLEASFGREAFQRLAAPRARPATALRAAYAIRWIELATGIRLPPFQLWDEACTQDP